MQVLFSTDQVAPSQRRDYWDDMLLNRVGVRLERGCGSDHSGRGTVYGRVNGPLLHLRPDADAQHLTSRGVPAKYRDFQQGELYFLFRESGGGTLVRQPGREIVTSPGDLLIAHASVPHDVQSLGRMTNDFWMVPKRLIDPHLPRGTGTMQCMPHSELGTVGLVAGFLDSLAKVWDGLHCGALEPAAESLCRLLGVALGAAVEDHSGAVDAARLAAAKRFIAEHLAETSLSPATAARALGISVRSLHALFEQTGTSFARYVQRKRLDECRRALLSCPKRSVTDIAFAWGFGSMANFYRAFDAAFGMSPGDLRARPQPAMAA